MPATIALGRRLGGPGPRRQRHRRFALGVTALLVLAAGLVAIGSRDDDGFDGDATAVCEEYVVRVQDEFRLSFPEGVPSDAAFAEYTSHAFADTIDELVAELTALEPPAAVAKILDGYRAVLADLRARPEDFIGPTTPFEDVANRMDDDGVPACGSDFFAAFSSPE